MPDWLIPALIASGGGAGVGALVTAVVNARSSVYTQLNSFVDQLQKDRVIDREDVKASRQEVKDLGVKVDNALTHLQIEREYSAALYAWGLAGAPPPPPSRRALTPPST